MMLLIVPVRVQDSRCMGLESVSCNLLTPSGVRLMVVLLVVVWPVVSNMPIYDCFLDMYVFPEFKGTKLTKDLVLHSRGFVMAGAFYYKINCRGT
jgi:hypothetical protein